MDEDAGRQSGEDEIMVEETLMDPLGSVEVDMSENEWQGNLELINGEKTSEFYS